MLTSWAGYIFGTKGDDAENEETKDAKTEDDDWIVVPKVSAVLGSSRRSSPVLVARPELQSLPNTPRSTSPEAPVAKRTPRKVSGGKKLKAAHLAALGGFSTHGHKATASPTTRSATKRGNATHQAGSGKPRTRKAKMALNPSGANNDRKTHAF